MNYKDYFKGKKITVMGLGLLGRGLGDVEFLASLGADLIVTDLKPSTELRPSLEVLGKYPNIKYTLGEHKLEDFRNRDMILKGAGVPLDSPFIAEARKNNVRIEMSSALFARLTEATIVGITGTRGKSTVTHLLYEVLKKAREDAYLGKTFLGGNVRGVATLPFLEIAKDGDIAVLELDSWQLQGFGESAISPHVSVFTNLLPDHLNYYKGDMNKYLDDKANIFKYQVKPDYLILGSDVAELVASTYRDVKVTTIVANVSHVPSDWKIKILGLHNRYNIALVIDAAKVLGVPMETIKAVVESFRGVPGRMELVREWNGINIYNDTTATSPDALYAALKALEPQKGKIILMGGGTDANLDLSSFGKTVSEYVKALILFKGTATEKIVSQLSDSKFPVVVVESMKDAIAHAQKFAVKGDTILLSPGAKSFGVFKNEFDRGDQFNALVKGLK